MDMSCRRLSCESEALEKSLGAERNKNIYFIGAFQVTELDKMPEKEGRMEVEKEKNLGDHNVKTLLEGK